MENSTAMTVRFYGYTVQASTLRKAQMILAQAKREDADGDIDAWFHAGCPVGHAYTKWKEGDLKRKA